MNDIISLSDINLIRGEKRILDHVDWHVRPGEHWAIVGPNGSTSRPRFCA